VSTAAVASSPWPVMALMLAAFLLIMHILARRARSGRRHPETARKLLHAGSGGLTLTFPFVFDALWPVLVLTAASVMVLAATRCVPIVAARFGPVTQAVGRRGFGELYFPIAVAMLFWLTLDAHPLLFVVPILVLTCADAAGALVGERHGRRRYAGGSKSLEGSLAFAATGLICVYVPFRLAAGTERFESFVIAASIAIAMALVEGAARAGRDNLAIPIGAYFLLRACMPLDAAALAMRVAAVGGVALLILASRHVAAPGNAVAKVRFEEGRSHDHHCY
jgi:phytol kinase